MATRRRITSFNKRVVNPGGGSSTVGNVAWGPDFGEASGADGITWRTGVTVAQPELALVGNKGVGVRILQPEVALVGDKGVGVHFGGTALGAPFWQTVATNDVVAANITINKPTGTVATDLMIAHIATNVNSVITAPAGWTVIQAVASLGTLPAKSSTWYKIATSSEAASYTFTKVGSSLVSGEIHRFNGTDQTTPIHVSAVDTVLATSLNTNPVSPSVTTTLDNCLVVAFLSHYHAALSQTHTPAAGNTERTDHEATSGTTIVGGHSMMKVFSTAGATGTATHTCTETVATDAAMTRIAIAPGTVVLA